MSDQVWFTSDLHLGHEKVARFRGFDKVDEHDATIMENISSMVPKGDQLWILGDLSSGSSGSERRALSLIKGYLDSRQLHLIPGNHDSCHPKHRDSHKKLPEFLKLFDSVQAFARRKIEQQNVWLSHYPWEGDHTDTDRDPYVRLIREPGSWILHGHTHSDSRVDGHQINVALEAWDLRPVSLNQIQDIIKSR